MHGTIPLHGEALNEAKGQVYLYQYYYDNWQDSLDGG